MKATSGWRYLKMFVMYIILGSGTYQRTLRKQYIAKFQRDSIVLILIKYDLSEEKIARVSMASSEWFSDECTYYSNQSIVNKFKSSWVSYHYHHFVCDVCCRSIKVAFIIWRRTTCVVHFFWRCACILKRKKVLLQLSTWKQQMTNNFIRYTLQGHEKKKTTE